MYIRNVNCEKVTSNFFSIIHFVSIRLLQREKIVVRQRQRGLKPSSLYILCAAYDPADASCRELVEVTTNRCALDVGDVDILVVVLPTLLDGVNFYLANLCGTSAKEVSHRSGKRKLSSLRWSSIWMNGKI